MADLNMLQKSEPFTTKNSSFLASFPDLPATLALRMRTVKSGEGLIWNVGGVAPAYTLRIVCFIQVLNNHFVAGFVAGLPGYR